MHPCDVFSDNVEFQIDHRASFYLAEIGMFKGVRNNRHFETIIRWCTHRKTNAIYGNRTFIYGEITAFTHVGRALIFKMKIVATIGIAHFGTHRRLIYVTLHNVSIKATVHYHAAFEIHFAAHFKVA